MIGTKKKNQNYGKNITFREKYSWQMICLSFRYTSQKKKLILWKLNKKKPVYEFTLSNAEMKKKKLYFKKFLRLIY